MWGDIVKRLPRFSSAVLTGLDGTGDPVSVRCQPTVDHQARVLRVLVPDGLGIVPGPAGLLCHRHDDELWSLKSFLLRGSLERTRRDWVFRPRQLVRGMDTTPLSNLRLLRRCRRTAKHYLAARGLRRPSIPWEHYAQLKDQDRAAQVPLPPDLRMARSQSEPRPATRMSAEGLCNAVGVTSPRQVGRTRAPRRWRQG